MLPPWAPGVKTPQGAWRQAVGSPSVTGMRRRRVLLAVALVATAMVVARYLRRRLEPAASPHALRQGPSLDRWPNVPRHDQVADDTPNGDTAA